MIADITTLVDRRERAHSERPPEEPDHTTRTPPRAQARAVVRAVVLHADAGFRATVAASLSHDDIAVVAEVCSPDVTCDPAPDVVIVGHRQPGTSAVDCCEALRKHPACPPLVIVAHAPRAVLLRRAIQVGVAALVAHDSPPAVLREAVRAAAAGRVYVDPALSRLVIELIARPPADQRPYGLTRAQLDVVALLPKGMPNREIAAELGISENTVKTHLRHALRKLDVRDRAQAATLVVREGLS